MGHARVGMTAGSNLGNLEKGSVILVIGIDLHQEAPLWWLRVKQAAQRGVTLIVANARKTRLDKFATLQRRYDYGEDAKHLRELFQDDEETAKLFVQCRKPGHLLWQRRHGVEPHLRPGGSLRRIPGQDQPFRPRQQRAHPGLAARQRPGAYELGIQPDADLVIYHQQRHGALPRWR